MKLTALLLSLLLAVPLFSCASPGEAAAPADDDPAALSAAGEADVLTDPMPPPEGEDVHIPSQGDNVIDHEIAGYCGNTITTVRYIGGGAGEEWEKSFWDGPSVELTDLLRYLDYSGDICRCLPEYEVKTEFSDSLYGINLTSAYARRDGKQVSLTEEQVELIRGIIDQISEENLNIEVK